MVLWAFREFAFDYQKIANLTYGWRVRVRCPSCGNIVEVVMLAYTLIHGCDPDKYKPGEIVEILPPDRPTRILRRSGGWRLINSEWRFSKRRLDGDLSHAPENHPG